MNTRERPKQRVVCAALRNGDRIICGPRHFDSIMRQQVAASEGIEFWRRADQGFVNQYGEFLGREEARMVALDNNQVANRCGGDQTQLYSENLY